MRLSFLAKNTTVSCINLLFVNFRLIKKLKTVDFKSPIKCNNSFRIQHQGTGQVDEKRSLQSLPDVLPFEAQGLERGSKPTSLTVLRISGPIKYNFKVY